MLGRVAIIPMTASLAAICLETERIRVFSSSPDRSFEIYVNFSLLDEEGRPYSTQAASSSARSDGRVTYDARRVRQAAERRARDQRTFCLYSALPFTMGNAERSAIDHARRTIAARIQGHFSDASVRACSAKTKGGRDKASDQFFITSRVEAMPQQYVRLSAPMAQGPAAADQPPLFTLRCVEVGEQQPALIRPSPQLRDSLGIKGCCMRQHCVAGSRGKTCNIMDLFFDARRAALPPRESDGKREYREAQADRARRQQRRRSLQQSEETHVQQQAAAVTGGAAARCQSWEWGRCSRFTGPHARHHQLRHGLDEETAIIACCSTRVSGDDGFSELFSVCPFYFSDEACPYMGHE
jgi:hypothetical protein